MIQHLNYKAEDGVLIEADVNDIHKEIRFSDIEPFWSCANEEVFENGRAYVFGNLIAFFILVASGQGGVIIIWDTEKECVVHISEAAFCEAVYLFKERVYYLCQVSNYNTPSHLRLYSIPMFTMDAGKTGERLYCQSPCEVFDRDHFYTNADLRVSDKGILVKIDDKVIRYSGSPDLSVVSKRNEEYAWLYDVFIDNPSNHNFQIVEEDGFSEKIDMDKYKVFGWLT